MLLPIGIVATEGKQRDVLFLQKQTGSTSQFYWNWGMRKAQIDSQGSIYTFDRLNYVLTKRYYTGIKDWDYFRYNRSADNFSTGPDGSTYIIGYDFSTTVYFLMKYDTYGNQVWVKNITQTISVSPFSLTVCSLGFIYVGAYYQYSSSASGRGLMMMKFDSDGNPVWAKEYETNNWNFSATVAQMSDISVNNTSGTWCVIFRTQASSGSSNRYSSMISGYTNNGDVAYTKYFNRRLEFFQTATDNNGNSYVFIQDYDNSLRLAIVKYDISGNKLTEKQVNFSFPGSTAIVTENTNIILSPDNQTIYLSSQVNPLVGGSFLYYWHIMKLDLSLNILWSNAITSNLNLIFPPRGLAVSPVRNFFVLAGLLPGDGGNSGSSYNGLLMKLPTDGSVLNTINWGSDVYTYQAFNTSLTDTSLINNQSLTVSVASRNLQTSNISLPLAVSNVVLTQKDLNL